MISLRSPVRPNPIGTSIVKLLGVEGSTVLVRGLDCLDGTPLVDLKPDRCDFTPLAPPQAALGGQYLPAAYLPVPQRRRPSPAMFPLLVFVGLLGLAAGAGIAASILPVVLIILLFALVRRCCR